MKQKIALALAACLLFGLTLTGCGGGNTAPATNPPATDPPATTAPDPTEAPAEPTDPPATPEPTEEPTPNIADLEIPPLLENGLELPVSGATGFASVNLPVWPANPGDRAGYKLASVPETPHTGVASLTTSSKVNSQDTASWQDLYTPETDSPDSGSADPYGSNFSGSGSTQFSGAMAVLVQGTGFQILEEVGDWWHINFVDQNSMYGESLSSGWIEHRYCYINLPDVIPSILYNDTNCSGSIFVSCGKDIPGVTGKSFYNTFAYNVRLARNEFIMPMLYTAARDVCAAQHKALAEGNCLEIYQTFRPLQTQKAVASAVQEMANADPEVKAGISTYPWSISWFIDPGTSDHQIGYALDATIVHMTAAEIQQVGAYSYFRCTEFERYEMPTPMHELSLHAASQVGPENTTLSEGLQTNEYAQKLREYFTTSGFTPRASEWWHFNNTNAQLSTTACPSKGDYFTEQLYSTLPDLTIDRPSGE